MDQQITLNLPVIISFLSIGGSIYLLINKMAKLELKVETMWDFMMRRAKSEGLIKGIFEMNSPITIKESAFELFPEDLRFSLKDFYSKRLHKLNEKEILLDLERNFGDRLLNEFCAPHNFQYGACLLIAFEVAKREATGKMSEFIGGK